MVIRPDLWLTARRLRSLMGWWVWRQGPDLCGLTVITIGAVEDTHGCRAGGFVRRIQERSGTHPSGIMKAAAGGSMKGTGVS